LISIGKTDRPPAGCEPTTAYCDVVPIIAVFFGIVIRMFYKEHEPEHFHAEHPKREIRFQRDDLGRPHSIEDGVAADSRVGDTAPIRT